MRHHSYSYKPPMSQTWEQHGSLFPGVRGVPLFDPLKKTTEAMAICICDDSGHQFLLFEKPETCFFGGSKILHSSGGHLAWILVHMHLKPRDWDLTLTKIESNRFKWGNQLEDGSGLITSINPVPMTGHELEISVDDLCSCFHPVQMEHQESWTWSPISSDTWDTSKIIITSRSCYVFLFSSWLVVVYVVAICCCDFTTSLSLRNDNDPLHRCERSMAKRDQASIDLLTLLLSLPFPLLQELSDLKQKPLRTSSKFSLVWGVYQTKSIWALTIIVHDFSMLSTTSRIDFRGSLAWFERGMRLNFPWNQSSRRGCMGQFIAKYEDQFGCCPTEHAVIPLRRAP